MVQYLVDDEKAMGRVSDGFSKKLGGLFKVQLVC